MRRMLESEEAARRLGVKLSTLYAYVSRGALASHPAPDGRRSLFALEDVERLARRARGGRRVETRLATVTTSVTQLREDGPAYRGIPAATLAGNTPFESVAELLWNTGPGEAGEWEAATVPPVPDFGSSDRLRWALIVAGASDRLRSDRRRVAVLAAARRSIATMVAALAPDAPMSSGAGTTPFVIRQVPAAVDAEPASRRGPASSVGQRLAGVLCQDPSTEVVGFVDATLVLLADNELATSTVAVRIAASTRADLYDALLAGLATLAGPLHGGASEQAYDLLLAVSQSGARAVDEALRWQDRLPGFDATVYDEVDPRFGVLKGFFERLATPAQQSTLATILELASTRGLPPPNVDLGIAALLHAAGMPRDAGRTMFAVARAAGWTAHYLEEMEESPLRFRPRAVYSLP